jgi:hypothetical protein
MTTARRLNQDEIGRMIDHQLGRRHMTPEPKSYLCGKRYNLEKKVKGGRLENSRKMREKPRSARAHQVLKIRT